MAHAYPPSLASSDGYHGFNARLADEAAHDGQSELLFAPHRLTDVSKVKVEQKNGNDFLLELLNHDGSYSEPIRCENKFESYSSGRLTLEWVSVDRPSLTPGWMVTSKTAWLLSWFEKTGDLIALPMDEIRKLVLPRPARNKSTTALNRSYLSWNTLEDINYLLANTPNARVLDLRYELGQTPERPSMVCGRALEKRCTSDELTALMRELPRESTPLKLGHDQLLQIMKELAPVNLKKFDDKHAARIKSLPWSF